MPDSTQKRPGRKTLSPPKKPSPDFPLTPHASGKWQKKIRGTTHYFGRWYQIENGKQVRVPEDGWREAEAEYKRQRKDLHAGRTPGMAKSGELTIGGLCNHFLTSKTRKLKADELSARMWQDYRQITDLLVAQFGAKRLVDDLSPADFGQLRDEIASRCGVFRRKNEIIRVRSVFKFGKKNGLMEQCSTATNSTCRANTCSLVAAKKVTANCSRPARFSSCWKLC